MKWWSAQPTPCFAQPPPAASTACVGAAPQVAPAPPAGRNLRAEVSPARRSTPNTAEDRRAYGPKDKNEKRKCRIHIKSRWPRHWGPIHLPGNKKGHIGRKECSLILRKTGWKVSTRCRGGNWKGNGWGCRMMSGRLQVDGCEDKLYESQRIAQDVILKQQRIRKFPCKGAAFVSFRARCFQRLQLKQPYNPKDHLPSQTAAGSGGSKDSRRCGTIALYTDGDISRNQERPDKAGAFEAVGIRICEFPHWLRTRKGLRWIPICYQTHDHNGVRTEGPFDQGVPAG